MHVSPAGITELVIDFMMETPVFINAEDASGNPILGTIYVDGVEQIGKVSPSSVVVKVGAAHTSR